MTTSLKRGARGQAGASSAQCSPLWLAGPAEPSLRVDEIHLWLVLLDLEASKVESLLAVLSTEERTRAGRFYFRRDRDRFIAARGLLRKILGRYLLEPPQLVRFRHNLHGKPALGSGPAGVRFNVSHSDGLALCAVALGREVGLDLERVRFDCAAEKIAARFFSAEEQAVLLSLPEPARTVAFFRYWTVKEAYLKAKGLGLWTGLKGLVVTMEEGEAKVLRHSVAQPGEENGWEIKTLEPQPGFAAALAAAGSGWRMRTWRWGEDDDTVAGWPKDKGFFVRANKLE